jgi:hypothetical protein
MSNQTIPWKRQLSIPGTSSPTMGSAIPTTATNVIYIYECSDLQVFIEMFKFNRRLVQQEPLRSILSGKPLFASHTSTLKWTLQALRLTQALNVRRTNKSQVCVMGIPRTLAFNHVQTG